MIYNLFMNDKNVLSFLKNITFHLMLNETEISNFILNLNEFLDFLIL